MQSPRPQFMLSLFMIGILAGCVGIAFTFLMHFLQHLTFGAPLFEEMPFRVVVEQASATRRICALVLCGLVVGIGWFCLHRYAKPLVDIKTAVNQDNKDLPFFTTISHSLLQIITVAMGSPLGREVAPREMSTAFANQWVKIFKLSTHERRVLLACASGAGLAAVYNVPLAAVIFVLETLLLSWSIEFIISALICCVTAVFVARLGLGDLVQYPLGALEYTPHLIYFALLVGPLLAVGVFLFEKSMKKLPTIPRDRPVIIFIAVLSFAVIGTMSIWYTEILGNGKATNQLSFAIGLSANYAIGLFVFKWLAIILATVGGAYGGRITPSMMLGGLIAFLCAYFWNFDLPLVPTTTAAIIGATVFLGLAFGMPITATVFLLELTRFSPSFLYPICLCFLTAVPMFKWLQSSKFV
ncbi:chloride channel protein [Acinetobacter sp. MD2(2019)]|uniref:chloride channel protein n=1 Tax=Acinetobacter sp. MD2(2019) TaxID=2605273 RepID=UPI002D1EBCE3|nr:chloride channel protein [Acinetobacter sp. MD2(2019)]MEB3752808.1 chloride channel protein [Acinetobacter sp. MD2(2019)]